MIAKPHIHKCSNPIYPKLWKCETREVGQYANSPAAAYWKWCAMGGPERSSTRLVLTTGMPKWMTKWGPRA